VIGLNFLRLKTGDSLRRTSISDRILKTVSAWTGRRTSSEKNGIINGPQGKRDERPVGNSPFEETSKRGRRGVPFGSGCLQGICLFNPAGPKAGWPCRRG
jgi:hypothetical protein